MGSCCSCGHTDPDGSVRWYQPCSPQSLAWCNQQTGYGYRRRRSYREIAIGRRAKMTEVNRVGNMNGELAGWVVTYDKTTKHMDYSTLPQCPTFNLGDGGKLFAKAFFPAPLNRVPIGQNNLPPSKEYRGRGATLLAPVPQAIAIYLDIDGEAQCQEHFCKDSSNGRLQELKTSMKNNKQQTGKFKLGNGASVLKTNYEHLEESKSRILKEAAKGSFYTFVTSKEQYPFCFLHLPLIGNLDDTNISTGYYGESLIRCFCELIKRLPPGTHKFELRICLCFDHRVYNYLVLGNGSNALGSWARNMPNSVLKHPHPKPDLLLCSQPIAQGSFVINTPDNATVKEMLCTMDRKPPVERYRDSDCERIRKIARTVAAGKFCESFNVSGLPDWVVLSSGKMKRFFNSFGRQYSYTVVEYAALWLNDANSLRPDAIGTEIDGAMAIGELSPGNHTEDWVWIPRIRNNHTVSARRIGVKNQFINSCMRGRRFSMFSSRRRGTIHISKNFLAVPRPAWEIHASRNTTEEE